MDRSAAALRGATVTGAVVTAVDLEIVFVALSLLWLSRGVGVRITSALLHAATVIAFSAAICRFLALNTAEIIKDRSIVIAIKGPGQRRGALGVALAFCERRNGEQREGAECDQACCECLLHDSCGEVMTRGSQVRCR